MDPEDSPTSINISTSPLLWTNYKRSYFVFGSGPLLTDNIYVGLFTKCLCSAWEVALPMLFESGGTEDITYGHRVKTLLILVANSLRAALPQVSDRIEYITYHRDWIIRFHALRSGGGQEHAEKLLAIFEKKLPQKRSASQDVLRQFTEASEINPEDEWQKAVCDLINYLRGLTQPFTLDPFAPNLIFSILFRLFHNLANGLGITPLNEGIAYQLLLRNLLGASTPRSLDMIPRTIAAKLPEVAKDNPTEEAPFDFEREYRWTEYIASSGPEGKRWVEAYHTAGREFGSELDKVLAILRQNQLDTGEALLQQIDVRRRVILLESPVVGHVLSRFYYGALSYFYYVAGDFEKSNQALEKAREAIRSALELGEWLLPFAALITDIPLKRAALARRAYRWDKMEECLTEFLEMGLNQRPLCLLHTGRSVCFHSLREFFAVANLNEAQRATLRNITEDRLRWVATRRSIERLYALPSLLIPYP